VNRNGLIETVAANQPRFDFDQISGECKGLLIEESRTNIVLNSTTLSSHTNSSTTTVLTTETTSPDGTSNAYKIIGNSGVRTRESIYTNSFTMNANSSYTASVFLKGTATRRYAVMWFDNTAPGNAPVEGPYYGASVFIDLLTGTSSNPSITKMISYGNGWYRCYLTATVGASNLTNVFFNVSIGSPNGFSDTGNPSQYKYVGDGISGFYYWGPQVEVGAFPTSYIPTSGSTVTRSPDIATIRANNFQPLFTNPNENTFYVEAFRGNGTGTNPMVFEGFDATTDSVHTTLACLPSNDKIRGQIRQGSTRYESSTFSPTVVFNEKFKAAIRTQSRTDVAGDSFQTTSNSYPSIMAVNGTIVMNPFSRIARSDWTSNSALGIGSRQIYGVVNYGSYWNNSISKIRIYSKALSDAQLQYLTQ